jgi:hypothetical protein
MKPSRNTAQPHRPGPSGEPIKPDELYPLSALHTRLGWGPRGLAHAKRQGLRILAFSKWRYVKGADLINFIERQAGFGEGGAVGQGGEGKPS